MNTEIFVVRHGAIDNPNQIVYGILPGFHLSDTGREQVLELADILKARNITFDAIYTSPLERAVETAQILVDQLGEAKLTIRDGLIDIQGDLQGKPLSILRKAQSSRKRLTEMGYKIEEHQDVAQRMLSVVNEIRREHQGERVAIVTHGDPSRIVLWLFQHPNESPPEQLHDRDFLETAEAVVLTFDENNQFVGWEHIRRT